MDAQVYREIQKHSLINPGDKVLVAVSGGPDSMALLHWLKQHQLHYQMKVMAIHVNHQLRGEESDLDQRYVERMCQKWQIPCISRQAQVEGYAQSHKLSIQVAARECRYQLIQETAEKYGYQKVATAHHSDDQLETIMMRLVRGAGMQGLSGIPIQRNAVSYQIIRPFISITKRQLERYTQKHQLHPRLDQSNLKDDYQRNYIRHHIIPPLLELNPNWHQTVYDMTELLREENEYMHKQTETAMKQVIHSSAEREIRINLLPFRSLALPLQRRGILLLLSYLPLKWGSWQKIHIDYLLSFALKQSASGQIDLPNQIQARKEYDQLIIRVEDNKGTDEGRKQGYLHILPEEGIVEWSYPPLRIVIRHSRTEEKAKRFYEQRTAWSACFDRQGLHFPLLVRTRKKGERMQPIGMQGRRKVKDIFIDQKIPVSYRDRWPLIADQQGIIWIPGVKRSDQGKISKDTEEMISIQIEPTEGDFIRVR